MEGNKIFAVALIPMLCVIFLGIIWSTVQTATQLTTQTNETFAVTANDTFVSLDNDDWTSCEAVRDTTQNVLAVNVDYVVDLTNGRLNITAAGGANGTGTYSADYIYKADSYMDSSLSRTVTGYLPIIFALVVFVFIAGFITLKKGA